MAIHSSILAWEIPWTEEPSGLQSMRSQKRHDLVTLSIISLSDSFNNFKGKGVYILTRKKNRERKEVKERLKKRIKEF